MFEFPILHTSDFHGHLDEALAAKIATRRKELGALYFDCGDAVKTGNLGVPTRPEKAWPLLQEIELSACTLGNRESHPVEAVFSSKLRGLGAALVANLRKKHSDEPLVIGGCAIAPSMILEHNGVRIGVLGLMVPMVTERMKTAFTSAFLWDDPIATAQRVVPALRKECDVLIALTHIGLRTDKMLAEACPDLGLILGGHSHDVLPQPIRVGETWISHTGSHGRFFGEYVWRDGALEGGLHELR
jgi:2',3'-cyclic-nucleotide 2'-phosphodiesterase (5'-nucleotidase family)